MIDFSGTSLLLEAVCAERTGSDCYKHMYNYRIGYVILQKPKYIFK